MELKDRNYMVRAIRLERKQSLSDTFAAELRAGPRPQDVAAGRKLKIATRKRNAARAKIPSERRRAFANIQQMAKQPSLRESYDTRDDRAVLSAWRMNNKPR